MQLDHRDLSNAGQWRCDRDWSGHLGTIWQMADCCNHKFLEAACATRSVWLAQPKTHPGPEWTVCETLQIDPWCLLKPLNRSKLQYIAGELWTHFKSAGLAF